MTDPTYWRLHYADDRCVDEPDDNASVLHAQRGAVALTVTRQAAVPGGRLAISTIALHDEGGSFAPVFYRRRRMQADAVGAELVATVFGRAREGEHDYEATLSLVSERGPSPCPQWAVDPSAVRHLVSNS